ncbi:MAG: membrane protein insertion efficiency factor YidD [Alphaproteobacteria bacterium]
MTSFFRHLIRIYSFVISPFLGKNCRFHPTCSAYADEALKCHGVLKGFYLSIRRILRCHPWSRAPFYDPVPKQFAWRDLLGYKRCIQNREGRKK